MVGSRCSHLWNGCWLSSVLCWSANTDIWKDCLWKGKRKLTLKTFGTEVTTLTKNSHICLRGVTALTNAVWADSYVNRSPTENLEYCSQFLGDIIKKYQTSRNLNFITSCLPENFLILPFPRKILDSQNNFVFLSKQTWELTPFVAISWFY